MEPIELSELLKKQIPEIAKQSTTDLVPEAQWSGLARYKEVDFRAELPPAARNRVLFRSPKSGEKISGLIVSRQLVSVRVHWMDGGKRPCTRTAGWCDGCETVGSWTWYGYVGVYAVGRNVPWLFEISLNAARSCPELIQKGAELRGRVLTLERQGMRHNSPVTASLSEPAPGRRTIPAEFDVQRELLKNWLGLDIDPIATDNQP